MRLACLLAAIAVAVPSISHATHVVVPGDYATIQSALDSSADTVFVASGDFAEHVVFRRGAALLPAPTNGYNEISLPAMRSLTIDNHSGWSSDGVIRGFRIRGPVTLDTDGHWVTLTVEGCRIEEGMSGGSLGAGVLHVQYCTILGAVDIRSYAVDFTLNTVLDGGVTIHHDGYQTVQGNYVREAPGTGITAPGQLYRPDVIANTIVRCPVGAELPSGGNFDRNVVIECGDGVRDPSTSYRGRLNLRHNRFERCGRGIYVPNADATNWIEGNVVLGSLGDGIAAVGYLIGNTVVRNAGNGIASPPSISSSDRYKSSTLERNVAAFNLGVGLLGSDRDALRCNDWFGNGAGATQGVTPGDDDIQLDPLFCDLAAGDVRVSAASPLWSAPCGPIGADSIGCGAQPVVLDAPRPAVSRLGVRSLNRTVELSLIDGSPASLEVIDVQGRRVSSVEVVSPRAGTQEMEIDAGLPTGIYFLRLRQAGGESSAKTVLLR